VVSGSPAAKAGLVHGDVIVNIAGTPINTADDLQKVIQKSKPGQTVTISYYVGDSKRSTSATLGSQQQAQAQPSTGGTTNPFGGGGFPGLGGSGGTGGTP
jgi:S1-C subfamily serine protease